MSLPPGPGPLPSMLYTSCKQDQPLMSSGWYSFSLKASCMGSQIIIKVACHEWRKKIHGTVDSENWEGGLQSCSMYAMQPLSLCQYSAHGGINKSAFLFRWGFFVLFFTTISVFPGDRHQSSGIHCAPNLLTSFKMSDLKFFRTYYLLTEYRALLLMNF